MFLSKNPSARALVGVGLFAVALAAGCNKPTHKSKKSAAPAASGSAAVAAAAAGPCQKYAAALCEKAGKESDSCQNLTAAADILSPAACTAGMKDIAYSLKKLSEANKSCEDLVSTLCAAIGPTTETCNMVKTQTKSFPQSRCKQMLQHIPEITADLKKMEAANQPLSADVAANIAKGKAPAFGPEDAKVTVVEFSDFQCPYCSRAATAVDQIKAKYGTRVRFVFRQFPLPMHQNARGAAEASLAANAQGKFWEFHDKMFQNQSKLDRADLEGFAKEAGLDVAAFKKALDSKTYAADVDADMKLGESVAVNGTPTMFINGARVQNPTSFEAISEQIEGALSGKPATSAHPG
ncbi:MAG TPA: thioredoxin domain-containing protein [Polyangiaceae bacterium]|nr:thioredoxin domain-containing protein [Polyangiaceae bacterium]